MYAGDTVRLKCHFKTFEGTPVTPDNVTLTIYKTDKTQIEQFILTSTDQLEIGVFYFDYTPASELNEFIFEFAGRVNGKPIIVRDTVKISFTQ
ncbi:hypothetical protein BTO30_07100 [Domibacillus antri]|uniref:Uncharacterized protein n=1 Tax=Domibacillus antri TaxID=1714264 RepID=A0A1Q8Q6D7_9BACI|nr:hypothetical protein [Domibacillus antri]OLN22904.1 hypothetical protein BTO30_07100 [Domibacillus antri]